MNGGESGIAVKGGEVLAILHERMQNMSGDPAARELYGALLRDAGKPYVEMVQAWIRTGKLVDPYEELLVKESKFINRGTLEMDYTDEYWERRYTVRVERALAASRACLTRTARLAQGRVHIGIVEAAPGRRAPTTRGRRPPARRRLRPGGP